MEQEQSRIVEALSSHYCWIVKDQQWLPGFFLGSAAQHSKQQNTALHTRNPFNSNATAIMQSCATQGRLVTRLPAQDSICTMLSALHQHACQRPSSSSHAFSTVSPCWHIVQGVLEQHLSLSIASYNRLRSSSMSPVAMHLARLGNDLHSHMWLQRSSVELLCNISSKGLSLCAHGAPASRACQEWDTQHQSNSPATILSCKTTIDRQPCMV